MGNGEILYGLADDGYVRRQLSMMNNGVKIFSKMKLARPNKIMSPCTATF